jgi:hypothetical protein
VFTQVLDPNVMTGLPGDLGQMGELAKLANADPTPALAGAGAALVVGLISTPLTGALIASYAPRSPVKGALLAVGLGLGTSLLMAALAGAGAAASVQSAQ